MSLRDATSDDLPGLLLIQNEAIATTSAIWDEAEVDLEERRAWLEARQVAGFPVVVAEVDGEVAGYATFGAWRPKSGYRLSVENSVYVHSSFHGRGLASALLDEIVRRARTGPWHRMVAMIESANALSIGLHERRGFRVVGQLDQVGTKFGRWLDLTIMQLDVSEAAPTPEP